MSDNQIEIVNTNGTAFYQFLMLYNSVKDDRRLPNKVTVLTDGDEFPQSKNYTLTTIIEDNSKIEELRSKIYGGKTIGRIANLQSVANNQIGIKICASFKTLEYEICLANVGQTVEATSESDLYKFMQTYCNDNLTKIYAYLNTLAGKNLSDEERQRVAIVLWKCIPNKGTFAQELSYYLEERMSTEGATLNFEVPPYIRDGFNHLVA